jgi:tRNA G37 N-methylase TrmD
MRIDILTLFPEMFQVFDYSIIGRAIKEQYN